MRRFRPGPAMLVGFSAALLFGSLWAATPASAATETWDTPVFGGYDWVVPAGVTTARFDVFGGQGAGVGASRGGDGGETAGTIAVTPGETLKINVGGAAPAPGLGSGLNGGGGAGSPICSDGGFACTGGGGGGASDVRQGGTATANRVLVAGGGGGAGGASSGFCNDFGCLVSVAGGDGADGGAPAAVRGADGVDGVNEAPHSGGCGGGGATQLGGGIRGGGTGMELCFGPTGNAANGGEGNGGRGGDTAQAAGSGGGGGGGYFGGGGGSGGAARSGGGGGGGGSGFAAAAATNVSIAGGVNGGDGLVTVTYGADVAPTNTAPPKISGTPAAGHTLTCAKGTWSGPTPRTYTRQWRRDNVAIPGQTNAAYLVAAGDVAHVIRCRVTAHNAFGQATATSAGLTIQTPPQSISPPAISGNPAPGQTLICGKGSWSGSTPLTYTRQWRRDGLAIGGATNSTYLVQAADAGHSLRCKVTAHNAAGSDSRTSAAVNVA